MIESGEKSKKRCRKKKYNKQKKKENRYGFFKYQRGNEGY